MLISHAPYPRDRAVESAPADSQQRFSGILNAAATALTFIPIVLLATVFYVCFHRWRRLFIEHVVFSMSYLSFVLVSLLPVVVFKLAAPKPAFALLLLFASFFWQVIYPAVSVRRFYLADSRKIIAWPASVALALVLYVLNSFFITAVQFTAGAVAIGMV